MKRVSILFYVHDNELEKDTIVSRVFLVENDVELSIGIGLEIESLTQRNFTVKRAEAVGEEKYEKVPAVQYG